MPKRLQILITDQIIETNSGRSESINRYKFINNLPKVSNLNQLGL